ncbi:uncharacterized protein LOC131042672 [Cryptomeria japonica]|uniref:uncharacterized protein LOC131042672 n=1 Tax=Cryptomeria japonica TaxID=3369 RepID=UPI0027DA6FA2|nr:uncharacterized protein LOC131042672 [Cryptomeria japonica]
MRQMTSSPLDGRLDCEDMLYEEPEPEDSGTDWVVLRVGGQVFETSKQTLCAEQSMLAAWVLRHRNNDDENRENSRVLRIDRDGQRFRHVLNYLRNGTVWLQDVASLRELLEEAEYFCLSGLQGLCEEKIRNIEDADAAMCQRSVEALQDKILNSVGSFEKFRARCGSGEVYAVLRGRRLGCRDGEEPEFRLDVDF